MRIRRNYILLAVFVLFSQVISAQTANKKGVLYEKALSGGFQLYGNGWAANFQIENIKDLHHTSFWQIEIGQLRNEREIKQSVDFGFSIVGINSPKPFVYGKQNNFYTISFSRGEQFLIGQRANRSGVEVSLKAQAGLSLGLLKPYYLQLLVPYDNQTYYLDDVRYSEDTKKIFLDWNLIYGSSGFAKGLDQIQVRPGLHAKAGLHFDWAFYEEFIKAIEVGASLDVYPKAIPIMVNRNRQVFTNFFIGLQFGKKS